jgi:hypothetical protein
MTGGLAFLLWFRHLAKPAPHGGAAIELFQAGLRTQSRFVCWGVKPYCELRENDPSVIASALIYLKLRRRLL